MDKEKAEFMEKIPKYSCPKGHDVPYRTWNIRVEVVEELIDKKGNPLYEASLYCFKCDVKYRISQLEKI